jgi:hypothetical protein
MGGFITFFKGRANRPFSKVEKRIQDSRPRWILIKLNWSFGGRNSLHLLWRVLYSKETLRSLLKPLLKPLSTYCDMYYKITVSILVFDLFPCSRITSECRFHLTYFCTRLELFPRGQSMQVHDLAKHEWSLFTEWKWVESTQGNSGL